MKRCFAAIVSITLKIVVLLSAMLAVIGLCTTRAYAYATISVDTPAAVMDGQLYYCSAAHDLCRVDPLTGEVTMIASHNQWSSGYYPGILTDENVFYTCGTVLHCYDLSTDVSAAICDFRIADSSAVYAVLEGVSADGLLVVSLCAELGDPGKLWTIAPDSVPVSYTPTESLPPMEEGSLADTRSINSQLSNGAWVCYVWPEETPDTIRIFRAYPDADGQLVPIEELFTITDVYDPPKRTYPFPWFRILFSFFLLASWCVGCALRISVSGQHRME